MCGVSFLSYFRGIFLMMSRTEPHMEQALLVFGWTLGLAGLPPK